MSALDDAILAHLAARNTTAPTTPTGLTAEKRRMLEQLGHMDAATAATTNVRHGRCPNCSAPILLGLCPWGMLRLLDPEPVSRIGEALASANGEPTYGVYRAAVTRRHIEHRDIGRIRGHPAGVDTDVHVEHHCGTVSGLPRQATCLATPRPAEYGDEAPY